MPPKKKVTKPSYKPTPEERQQVERMSAVGIPQESIARVVNAEKGGIDVKTLRKHFRVELDTAKIKADAVVSGSLYNKCVNGDTSAIIWWEKTRQGRKETQVNEHAGEIKAISVNYVDAIDAKRITNSDS